jgi:hypothetical protein
MEAILGVVGLVVGFVIFMSLLESREGLYIFGGLAAIGAVYLFLPDQASYVATGVVGVGAAYFVGLPMLLAWAWPVIAIVGLFVLANALFPSKRA